jgi:hypothetical protein
VPPWETLLPHGLIDEDGVAAGEMGT